MLGKFMPLRCAAPDVQSGAKSVGKGLNIGAEIACLRCFELPLPVNNRRGQPADFLRSVPR